MENKIEKMTQFLADNKIECFDIQKMEDEHHTTIFRSRMEVKGQLLPMALLMDDSVYMLLQVQIAPQVIDEEKMKALAGAINNMNNKKVFAFGRTNFILLTIGMAIVILGFILMSGNGSDETQFDPSIFDARRIKVAPIVCLFGYLFMIFAIVFKPKDKQIENNETKEA